MLSDFVRVAQSIGSVPGKLEKERRLAEYLRRLDDATLERAAVFFSGGPFPRRDERVTGVGGATMAGAALGVGSSPRPVTLVEVGEHFDRLAAASGSKVKRAILADLLRRVDKAGADFILRILAGELRIGLQEGLVESAIAAAFGRTVAAVRRANMFTGDIGATALLAKSGMLETAKMTLFHPFAFMLAQPEEDPDEIAAALGPGAFVDDKYDGIRAQIHAESGRVRIFSRTFDNVTHRFPELEAAARGLDRPVIFDGEIVAFRDRVLPFAVLQTRLGRRTVTTSLLDEAPIRYFAFDLLFDGDPLFELPLSARLERLRTLLPRGAIHPVVQSPLGDAARLETLFDAARARGNEGLVIKDPASVYTPGRRGKAWLKYKKALATLDCVVTAAEYGHGKRHDVLSDYTFAVRRDGELVNIGKAYSGLTDEEIARLTGQFKSSTTSVHGSMHVVRPAVILEIAFDRIQESSRHGSGYALRFPRIVRIRDDKTVEQISTIDEVRRLHEAQRKREEGG